MTYQELKAEENQYVMNTYGRFPIALDHGEGATVWDVEGKKYIDLASGIGVNCLGYITWGPIDILSSHCEMAKRYGFVFVNRTEKDLRDLRRVPKKSFYWVQKVFGSNGEELDG